MAYPHRSRAPAAGCQTPSPGRLGATSGLRRVGARSGGCGAVVRRGLPVVEGGVAVVGGGAGEVSGSTAVVRGGATALVGVGTAVVGGGAGAGERVAVDGLPVTAGPCEADAHPASAPTAN